jgi:hypothetical protein
MRSPLGSFSASACHFVHWNNTGSGAPALDLQAGATIIQGCTFGNMGTQVRVGPKVRSALIIGNQASDGIIVTNQAGKRTQMLANEEDPVDWSPEARVNYRLSIGEVGDGRWVEGFNGRETHKVGTSARTYRWSTGSSRVTLPVRTGRSYTLTLAASVPQAALGAEAGVYIGKERVAAFTKAGYVTVSGRIEAAQADTVTLTVRCRGWVPNKLDPRNGDMRTLGVQVHAVTMRARRGAGDRVFDGNTGRFVGAPAP